MLYVYLGAILCVFMSVPAQAQETMVTKVEQLLTDLETQKAEWKKLQKQTILVVDISPMETIKLTGDDTSAEKNQLEIRLEALQNKKISNREWFEYWENEKKAVQDILNIYDQLLPKSGDDLLAKASQAKMAKAQQAKATWREKKGIYDTLRGPLEKQQAELLAISGKLKTEIASIEATQEIRNAEIAAKRNKLETEQELQLKTDLENEISQLKMQIQQSNERESNLELKMTLIESALKGTNLGKGEKVDEQLSEQIQSYLTQKEKVDQSLQDVLLAKQTMEQFDKENNQFQRGISQFNNQRSALISWQELAKNKVKNQDIYYEAIKSDINAINSRLRSLKVTTEEEEVSLHTEEICNPHRSHEGTPYQVQRDCVAAIRAELNNAQIKIDQLEQRVKLTNELKSSSTKLIRAQEIDVMLNRQEYKIGESEWNRIRQDADSFLNEKCADSQSKQSILCFSFETAIRITNCKQQPQVDSRCDTVKEYLDTPDCSESECYWAEMWLQYGKKALNKRDKLDSVLKGSKKTQRKYKAKLGVFEDSIIRLKEQQTDTEAQLAARNQTSKWIKSILASSWKIMQVGWKALVYILIAFTLVRVIRKYRDKQEAKLEESKKGNNNKDLLNLRKQLEEARQKNDDSSFSILNEEIGRIENRERDQAQRLSTLAKVGTQAATLIIGIATFLLVLDALTVDISPILGGAAIFGLAISFGSQSLVKDVVSGFFILLENQYAVGDVVSINGQSGTVEKITLRRTVLRDMKGQVHNITNGSISAVINLTQGWSRVVFKIGVSYSSDLKLVEKVINKVGEEMYDDPNWSGKLTEEPKFVGITSFGASEIEILVLFKTRTFENWGAEREFNYRIKKAFDENNIEIPYPQQDVHVYNNASPIPLNKG